MKAWFAAVAMTALVVLVPGGVEAAQKDGCSNERSGFERKTVEAVGMQVWGGLVDRSPWKDVGAFTSYLDEVYNRNGDKYLCVGTRWGTRPAEQAHWYLTSLFIVGDNNANGAR